jgi:hypothetical protein
MATLTNIQLDQHLSVEAWRHAVLLAAGYPDQIAQSIAACLDVDLHLAVDLLDNGCPPLTAIRILL